MKRRKTGTIKITNILTRDILESIFRRLTGSRYEKAKTLLACRLVDKAWSRAATNPLIWKTLFGCDSLASFLKAHCWASENLIRSLYYAATKNTVPAFFFDMIHASWPDHYEADSIWDSLCSSHHRVEIFHCGIIIQLFSRDHRFLQIKWYNPPRTSNGEVSTVTESRLILLFDDYRRKVLS